MTETLTRPSRWQAIRSDAFHPAATDLIRDLAPAGPRVLAGEHVRSAHYAVYRVRIEDGADHVVRLGVVDPSVGEPVDNAGFSGTSAVSPTGSCRRRTSPRASRCRGLRHRPFPLCPADGLDALWMPFVEGSNEPVTAVQWHAALTALQAYRPEEELPVFTNRAKTCARLEALPESISIGLRNQYDTALEDLFENATQWSMIHGDAHAGNALLSGGAALLYDFDTACWAPSVWDLTHPLSRAGTGQNTGYTVAELLDLYPFKVAEVSAAMALRKVAAGIARPTGNTPHWAEHELPSALRLRLVACHRLLHQAPLT